MAQHSVLLQGFPRRGCSFFLKKKLESGLECRRKYLRRIRLCESNDVMAPALGDFGQKEVA